MFALPTSTPGSARHAALVSTHRFPGRLAALGLALALAACAGSSGTDPVADVDGTSEADIAVAGVATGPDVPAGAAGPAALVAIVAEPAGMNCAQGGSRTSAGTDSNRDGVLDPGEVTATGYVCNGASGATAWVSVTDAAVSARANTGYLAERASEVVITLPQAPAVGDTVSVTGVAAGGWRIAQNAGQQILTQGLPGGTRGKGLGRSAWWQAIASSADGTRLLAAASGEALEISIDSGRTWTATSSGDANWTSAASSADGSVLVAAASGNPISVSVDGGATWASHGVGHEWTGVAVSADGTRMLASVWNGPLLASTDSGTTWTVRESTRLWNGVASSADGIRLAALAVNDGIYMSDDGGATWTRRAGNLPWMSVASSADGSHLVAAGSNTTLFTSSDFGVTWTARDASRQWNSVASSSDGTVLVATHTSYDASAIYTSSDAGATWTQREFGAARWADVAMNASGSRFVVPVSGDLLYGYTSRTTTGTTGSLAGARYDSVTLQFVGEGVFIPIAAIKQDGAFDVR